MEIKKSKTLFHIFQIVTHAADSKIKTFNNEDEAQTELEKMNQDKDIYSTYELRSEVIIMPIPNFFIGQPIYAMFKHSEYKECECCKHMELVSGEKKLTPGIIKDIKIGKDGISYGVDHLDKSYPDTTYLIEEKDIYLELINQKK
ncbi:hypothetical protein CPG37_04440 [Malaciobacter canalis]|uniref:DUF3299 domain-containing protein n=1 Tax=Malaciobacter canalis TaxID=1912871 RepID=A0ABX4LRT3_9BACT|nr:hypothetical protein [Malaciobacter canalis]PHO10300.1 hypothetical protein CPG37_04440 [Malaciobacter canalis]QEE32405.1 hypothetical protein ACAN_0916 [Malaciobacter canalis]